MYLFTEYVFGESVDSAHISQISSTFQEADCLLKLVTINKQVFAITLSSRNLNHTAQLSISARGEILIFSVGLGGNNGKDPTTFHVVFPFWKADATEKGNWVFSVPYPPPPPPAVEAVAAATSVHVRKRPNILSCSVSILEGWCNRKGKLGLFRFLPPPPSRSCSCCYQWTCIYSLDTSLASQ